MAVGVIAAVLAHGALFYQNDFGADTRFRTSDQLMRLGVRLTF